MVSNLFSIFLLLFLLRCTYVHDDFLIVPLLEDQRFFLLLLHETGKPESNENEFGMQLFIFNGN
jgi:hypothetical protein